MRHTITSLFAGVGLAALAMPAFAQDTPQAGERVNDDEVIIVEVRRKAESIQDVPVSVAAVTGQDLQKLEIKQFEDISKVVPGLNLSRATGFTVASLRGVDFDPRSAGASTTVEFYRNDSVTTADALFQSMYDIGQVEVLRGPQGTLRGRASPSGALTVTTKRPNLTEPGGYASFNIHNQHQTRFEAAVNVPVIGDKLGIRVAGFFLNSRGNNIYGMNVPTGAIDRDIWLNSRGVRASVRADPFDGVLVLDFNYETIKNSRRQYSQVVSTTEFTGSTAASDQSPRLIRASDNLGVGAYAGNTEQRFKIYNWQAVLRQFGQRFTYVGSRIHYETDAYGNPDNAGLFGTAFPVVAPPAAPLNTYATLTLTRVTQMNHEWRLQNEERVAGVFDYVVGAFKTSTLSPTNIYSGSVSSLIAGSNDQNVAVPLRTYGLNAISYRGTGRYGQTAEFSIFGNLTAHIGESTEISGGIRKIWYKSNSGVRSPASVANILDNPATWIDNATIRRCYGFPEANTATFTCNPKKEATIYAASIKHNFTEDLMAYFSFGTSWRPGNDMVGYCISCGGTPILNTFITQFLSLPDEKSKSFEIGFKSAWFDRKVRFNVSAFYQKFKNYPLYGTSGVQSAVLVQPNGTPPPAPVGQLAGSFLFSAPVDPTIKGFEADLAWDVSRNFKLNANIAFADSKVTNARVPCVDLNDDNIPDTFTAQNPLTYAQLSAHVTTNQVDTCRLTGSPTTQPRWTGSVQAEYSHDVGIGEAFIRTFVSWKGFSENDPVNPNDSISAYALVDLFAGLRGARNSWEATAYVKNLFDVRKVLGRSQSPLTSSISAAGTTATYNYNSLRLTDPREVGVTLRYSFGSR